MPDSVKISELNPRTAVASDVLPAVDSTFSQTVRVTAQSIAQIGGGPPGDNTVTTAKLADGSVTAPKVGFSAPNKLITRTAAGAGGGIEIDCTPYARGLLAAINGATARAYLDALQSTADPVFTGQIRVSRGTVDPVTGDVVPSIVPVSDLTTGIFFPQSDAMAIAANGREIFRWLADGSFLSRSAGDSILRPRYSAVAWVNFNGFAASGSTQSITANQHAVAARYGLTLSGAPSAILATGAAGQTTRAYLQSLENSRGIQLNFPTSPTFADKYGKTNPDAPYTGTNVWPRYHLGTEQRANYFSPGDDVLWFWTGSAWATTPASGKGWIGTIELTSQPNTSIIRDARGIVSVARSGTTAGLYTCTFSSAMPDANYCVMASCNSPAVVTVQNLTTTSFQLVAVNNTTGAAVDPSVVCAAVFR